MVSPGVYIDGAHNPDGIDGFLEAVKAFPQKKEITLLFSAVRDKQYADMIKKLAGLCPEQVVVTRIGGSRAVPEEELAERFRAEGCRAVFSDPAPEKAFQIAMALKGDGLLFCTGSLYLAGELLKAAERERGAEE